MFSAHCFAETDNSLTGRLPLLVHATNSSHAVLASSPVSHNARDAPLGEWSYGPGKLIGDANACGDGPSRESVSGQQDWTGEQDPNQALARAISKIIADVLIMPGALPPNDYGGNRVGTA